MAKGDGLKEAADREADKAEAEAAAKKGEKKDTPRIWDRAPSKEDVARAQAALVELNNRAQDMGPDGVVDALLQVVDVLPGYRMPDPWPGKTEEVLRESPFAADIGRFLLRGCSRLEVSPQRLVFLWRNKKTWTQNGVEVRAKAVPLSELSRFFTEGAVAAVICNFQLFRYMTTRQKIAAIYHALRQLDAEGQIRPPQFSGFFDELQLFGTGTNDTDVQLVRAIEQGSQRELPFGVSPLSVPGLDEDAAGEKKERRVG